MTDVIWSWDLLVTEPNLEIICSSGSIKVHREVLACHSTLLKEILLAEDSAGPIYLQHFQLADIELLVR